LKEQETEINIGNNREFSLLIKGTETQLKNEKSEIFFGINHWIHCFVKHVSSLEHENS
jgi:hypothetical protein